VRGRARALTAEAARVRMELRRWDLSSPDWVDRVHTRLDELAEGIETPLQASPAALKVSNPAAPQRMGSSSGQVERTVYDYLYRCGPAPALG
jgi:hypothetical protein